MIKDYSFVPTTETIVNNFDYPISIRINNLIDETIEPGNTLKVEVTNSTHLALLKNKIKELGLTQPNIYASKEKIADYLYKLTYNDISEEDEAYARKYIKEHHMKFGACSSVRKGNYYGRNYDWYYDYSNNFVSFIPHSENRYASMSVTSFPDTLSKEVIDNDEYSDLYKVVPFLALDGINEFGVVANMNVTSEDKGITRKSTPAIEERDHIGMVMVVRYILDKFQTAKEAGEYIRDYVALTALNSGKYVEELHIMIGDPTETYLIEVIDGENKLYKMEDEFDGRSFMTNFHLTDTTVDTEGHIDFTSVVPHGMGLERYNIICDNFTDIETETDMIDLMHNKLRYTRGYNRETDPFWKTELCHDYGEKYGDLTVTTPLEAFEPIIEKYIDMFEHRTREKADTWQSVHSSIYSINEKHLSIFVQEEDTKYEFDLEVN